MRTQDWPMLTTLDVYKCPLLNVFEEVNFQNRPDLDADQQALVSAVKVTPHLEELSLNKYDVMMIEQGQLHVNLQKLKFLKLRSFHDEEEADMFSCFPLSKVPLPGIEGLEVCESNLKEIFPSQRPDMAYTKILSRLKGLELNNLPMLESIGLEQSWMSPFLAKVKHASFTQCHKLRTFCRGHVLHWYLRLEIDGYNWSGDNLNDAIKREFAAKDRNMADSHASRH
ncbi:hypothetical protein RIF29_16212 [Crotalaria pallida]|uniref:Uncharacterized protein n=1 Tax=Crotalaria pallida TaxID=3830 RepID=A0AAN9FG07_CROPI